MSIFSKVKGWFTAKDGRDKPRKAKGTKKVKTKKKIEENTKVSFSKVKQDIRYLKEAVGAVREQHIPRLDRVEKVQQKAEETLGNQWKWIQHLKDRDHEQREMVFELKAEIQKMGRSVDSVSSFAERLEALEKLPERLKEIDRILEALRSQDRAEVTPPASGSPRATTSAVEKRSPLEHFNSLRPNERRVFGLLFNQFTQSEGGWVPFAELRKHAYPNHEDEKTATSLLAKALAPLYEKNLAEKQKQKNSAIIRPTEYGVDIAKEMGMIEQKKKLDNLYSRFAA